MAALSQFNPDAVSDDREIIAAGNYNAQIIESSLATTKSGGTILKLTWEILDGPLAKRRVWENLNIVNSNADVQAIAERSLKRICGAVGHTGVLPAAITAVETVDRAVGEIVAAVRAKGGELLVTADHGNCEMMVDPATGGPHTAHTLNPVPVILVGGPAGATLHDGRLGDLAPTLLALMGLEQPPEMSGKSLLAV